MAPADLIQVGHAPHQVTAFLRRVDEAGHATVQLEAFPTGPNCHICRGGQGEQSMQRSVAFTHTPVRQTVPGMILAGWHSRAGMAVN